MRELITQSWTTDWVGIYTGVVYDLDDGSRWEVIDHRSKSPLGFRKRATVTRSRGKYRIKFKGDRKGYLVKPLALPNLDPIPMPRNASDQLIACLFTDLNREIASHQNSFQEDARIE
jgi:hypothetical protein